MELPTTHLQIFEFHFKSYVKEISFENSPFRVFFKSVIKLYLSCISFFLHHIRAYFNFHRIYITTPFTVLRLCQYGSKLLGYVLEVLSKDQNLIRKIKSLEETISSARKLLRLGKSLDSLRAASLSIHLSDIILRLTITLSRINQAIYLLFDNTVWAGKLGLANVNIAKLSTTSAKFWFLSLVMNLVRDVYELRIIYLNAVSLRRKKKFDDARGKNPSPKISLTQLMQENKAIFLDTLKNICDIWLPLNSLGLVTLNPGIIGLLGLISSIVAIYSIIDPTCKLQP